MWLRGWYSICSHSAHPGRPVPVLTNSSLNQPHGLKEVLRLHWRIQWFLPKQFASLREVSEKCPPIPYLHSHTGESSRLGTNPVQESSFPMSSPPPNSSPIHITAFEWSQDLEWLVCAELSRSVMSDSLWAHGLLPVRLLCPWDSPGKNTRVGCHCPPPGLEWHTHFKIGNEDTG